MAIATSVDIRGLQTTALVTFVAALVLNTSDGWLFPSLDATGILVWLALNGLVSGIYIVALLWAVARVAQIAKDQAAARSAQYAALMFGLCYGIVTAFYALGLVPALRAHIQYLYSGEARTELITSVIVLSVLALLGLVGYIHALWRLKGLHVDPTA